MTSSDHSVTRMVNEMNGPHGSQIHQRLVDRYLERLARLAKRRLAAMRTYEDEQDVALSAMNTFLVRASAGEFPRACDRNALWSLLVAITLKKTASLQRRHLAEKRDVRRNRSLELLLKDGPADSFVQSVVDEGNRLFEILKDESLQRVARLRMEGYSNDEIATRIDRSVKTVERRLKLIRTRLRAELDSVGD